VNGGDKLPDLERLWLDLVQKDIRRNTWDGVSSRTEDEDNFVLVRKGKKTKGKKAIGKIEFNQNGGKKRRILTRSSVFIVMDLDIMLQNVQRRNSASMLQQREEKHSLLSSN